MWNEVDICQYKSNNVIVISKFYVMGFLTNYNSFAKKHYHISYIKADLRIISMLVSINMCK